MNGPIVGELPPIGDPSLDREFRKLYLDFNRGGPLSSWQELAKASITYFDRYPDDYTAHDGYFNIFIAITHNRMLAGQFHWVAHIWEEAIKVALNWERASQGRRVHKGTPYYFWGKALLLSGDLDRGYLVTHQSLEEDRLKSPGQDLPSTPATALVTLNHTEFNQAFREWVVEQANYVSERLVFYNQKFGRALTLDEFRNRFLLRTETDDLFLFSFTVARLMAIEWLPEHSRLNQFAGQLEINVLFDLALVIDGAIKRKPPIPTPAKLYFNHLAEHLLARIGNPLSINDLAKINRQFENDFDVALGATLDGTMAIVSGQPPLNPTRLDVALTYVLRNHGAHNSSSAATLSERFIEVRQSIFNVLFMTVEHLY